MTDRTILLIDDDETLLELLAGHMRRTGYVPLMANHGSLGLQMADEKKPDLVVLDVMMPGMDGWEVCRRLREHSTVPIIMLSAKGTEFDKLHGFHLGVDDYVTKPFAFAELVARVGAVLSRARPGADAGQRIICGDLTIDLAQHRVIAKGETAVLTPTEYRLLEILARHVNRTVTADQLLAGAWGPEYHGQLEHVKHYIWSLRKKIEYDPGDPKHIITERGFGYRLE